jgi:hypothetical protein
MDFVRASADLARPPRLRGAQAALHRMQSREDLLFEGQDSLAAPRCRFATAIVKTSTFSDRAREIPAEDVLP